MPTSKVLKSPKQPKELAILTNQLHFELPADNWAALLTHYSIWRYQLKPNQHFYGKNRNNRYFYASFTNAYKNQLDRPFYYYTHDKPYASLYALLPHG